MKLLEPIQVGKMTLKNRIMFPPLTTGYEERDGSIGQRSLSFYERLAKGVFSSLFAYPISPWTINTRSSSGRIYVRYNRIQSGTFRPSPLLASAW